MLCQLFKQYLAMLTPKQHWHGLAQRLAPFADGTPLASQWPIPPGHFFDYEIATENDDSGTYFYHSHLGMQEMAASGPLIVDDCETAPFQYHDERIFHFQGLLSPDGSANGWRCYEFAIWMGWGDRRHHPQRLRCRDRQDCHSWRGRRGQRFLWLRLTIRRHLQDQDLGGAGRRWQQARLLYPIRDT